MKKRMFAALLAAWMLAGSMHALAVEQELLQETQAAPELQEQEVIVEDSEHAKTAEEGESYGYIDMLSPVNGLSCSNVGEDYVTLSWYGWSWDSFDFYEVAQYDADTDGYTLLKQVDADKEKTKIGELKSAKAYQIAIRKVRVYEDGSRLESPYSTVTVTTAPKAAKLRSAVYSGKGKLTVKWNKVSGAQKYVVEYGTSKRFSYDGHTMYRMLGKSKTSVTLSKLAGTTYYVRVLPCVANGDAYSFSSKNIAVKSVAVRSGLSLRELLNSIDTKDNRGRAAVKKLTNKKVDIAKYRTTYDKVMAVYKWHTAHAQEFVHCLACNANFNDCLYAMFGEEYNTQIWIAAGDFKNSNGTRAMHKWSAVYLKGVPYLFDPRMQKYIQPNGTEFFGFGMNSSLYRKRYAFEGWYYHW